MALRVNLEFVIGDTRVNTESPSIESATAIYNKLNGGSTDKPNPKPSAKPTGDASTTPPAASPAPAASTASAPAPAKQKLYTDTPLSGLINECVKTGKMDSAKAILAEMGVKKGPELKPEQFEAAEAKFKALLATEEGLG